MKVIIRFSECNNVFPKLNTNAYLNAEIPNWNQYRLLGGNAQIYLDNTYKGEVKINSIVAVDTLHVSLGIDPEIFVTRESSILKKKKTFWKNKIVENKEFKISVKSNKENEITLVINDQYPLSDHEDIDIKLLEHDRAMIIEKSGFLIWREVLKPKSSINKIFSYEIKYPSHVKIY